MEKVKTNQLVSHSVKLQKKMQQEMVEQLISKESMINKETMNNPIEIEKS